VEADDVVRQQPPVDPLAHPPREDPPAVRLRPGDVHEVVEEGVRARLADPRRARVQVVVVKHDQRLGVVLDGVEHGRGDVRVHRLVPVFERVRLLLADVRRVGEVPQVVLDEPQDRVRDHVVEAVVGHRIALHEQDVVAHPVELLGRRPPRRLPAHLHVLLGHRRGDPQRAPMRDEPAQGGYEPAPAAPHGPLARGRAMELGRAPVRDDHQAPIRAHLPALRAVRRALTAPGPRTARASRGAGEG
jgi:hypothetical protein